MTTPRFHTNPYLPLVRGADGWFFQCSLDTTIELPEDAAGLVAALVDGGGVTMDELLATLPAETVVRLFRQEVLVDSPLPTTGRDSRTAGFYQVQGRSRVPTTLARTHALVLGAGGVGSHVAWMLVALGVRRLTLVDDDVVEDSNLNRQLLYTADDVGQPKVEALAAHLRTIRPDVAVDTIVRRVDGPQSARDLVATIGCTVVVKAIDSPPAATEWVDAACVAQGVPYVQGGFVGGTGIVGPTVVPGRTPCHACVGGQDTAELTRVHGTGPSSSPMTARVAAAVAAELVRVVSGEQATLGGRVELHDDASGLARRQDLPRSGRCERCGLTAAPPPRPRPERLLTMLHCVGAAVLPIIATEPGWKLWWTFAAVAVLGGLLVVVPDRARALRTAIVGGALYAATSAALTLRFSPAVLGLTRVDGVSLAHAALYLVAMVSIAVVVVVAVTASLAGAADAVVGVFRRAAARRGTSA
jgi:molybdopterin/thiamine biosynthesis adenylyltransferase